MTTPPADAHRDPETLARLARIAAAIFARRGVAFTTARRAGGWTNATWLAGSLALRLAVQPGTDKIRREARLAGLFPPEVGCPPILETGVSEGHEWSLAREIVGRNLGEVWPALDWDERISALRQLWQCVLAVHRVNLAAAQGLARRESWFYPSSPADAAAKISRQVGLGLFSPGQAHSLQAALDRFWQVLPAAEVVLNHGDLTIENALWHEGRVVALLDFEFAVIAPPQLDLNELIKQAFAPPERPDPLPDPGGAGLRRLQTAVAEMARPLLRHPINREVLIGYAVLLELWMLEEFQAHPEGEGPLETWPPYHILLSLTDGKGGYLAPLLSGQLF